MDSKNSYWAPLDNAAKIFPAIRNSEHTAVIRLTVVLKERVNIRNLLNAIKCAEERFPYFKVRLRRGFFWYYLEQSNLSFEVNPDKGTPCQSFKIKQGTGLMLRVLVYKNQISVECSHILTDGHGLLNFLKSVLVFYYRNQGVLADSEVDPFYKEKGDDEEMEDAYNKYFKNNIPHNPIKSKAFHLPYKLRSKPRFDVLLAIVSLDDIKQKAKEKGVSITDYLVSAYLMVLQDEYFRIKESRFRKVNTIARIQVPINLRNIYSSRTMRNFSLFVMPEIDFRLGRYSFDEVLKVVYHKMKLETDEKLISKIISRNVGGERKIIVRGIPLLVKSLILYMKYYTEGINQYSGVITNLGKIELPEKVNEKIDHFILTPPPPNKKLKINCGVIGFGDKLVLSFGNVTDSKVFERKYIEFLIQQNLKVKVTKY